VVPRNTTIASQLPAHSAGRTTQCLRNVAHREAGTADLGGAPHRHSEIQKQQRRRRLILRGRSDIARGGQRDEKLLHLAPTQFARMPLAVGENESTNLAAHLVQQPRMLWRSRWHRACLALHLV